MPIGSTSGARPKRLPSFQASAIGRRLTGTMARISLPDGSSPWPRSHSPIAPETQASRTSLIEQPSALPIAFTWSSAIGSPQATRLRPHGLPFSKVGESSAIRAIAATSPSTLATVRAPSIEPARPRCGSASASSARAMLASTTPAAFVDKPPSGFITASASQSPPSDCAASAARRWRLGGSLPPSVIVIITEMRAMPSPMQ